MFSLMIWVESGKSGLAVKLELNGVLLLAAIRWSSPQPSLTLVKGETWRTPEMSRTS